MWLLDKADWHLQPGTKAFDYMTTHDSFVDQGTGALIIQEDMESIEKIALIGMTMSQYWEEWVAERGPRSSEVLAFLAHDYKTEQRQEVGLCSVRGKELNEESIRWLTAQGYQPSFFYNYEKDELAFQVKFKPVITASKIKLPADGKSTTNLSVELSDENGRRATNYRHEIHFNTSAGSFVGGSAIRPVNGKVSLVLRAPEHPETASIKLTGPWLWDETIEVVFE